LAASTCDKTFHFTMKAMKIMKKNKNGSCRFNFMPFMAFMVKKIIEL